MGTISLKCAAAEALFYEPDGLLLCASLLPVDDRHDRHVLAFQLSYLNIGEIVVHVAVTQSVDAHEDEDLNRSFMAVPLCGSGDRPRVWLSSLPVPDTEVHYHYTVWGQACGDDMLRGELTAEVSGVVPQLTVTTRVSVTRAPIPTDVAHPAVPVQAATSPHPAMSGHAAA